jgi:hypothetical protein
MVIVWHAAAMPEDGLSMANLRNNARSLLNYQFFGSNYQDSGEPVDHLQIAAVNPRRDCEGGIEDAARIAGRSSIFCYPDGMVRRELPMDVRLYWRPLQASAALRFDHGYADDPSACYPANRPTVYSANPNSNDTPHRHVVMFAGISLQ